MSHDSGVPFGLGVRIRVDRIRRKHKQAKGPMKNNSWKVEIAEDDHGEGVDIMAIVEADLAEDPEEAALVSEMERGKVMSG
jgi:hypothetical protein